MPLYSPVWGLLLGALCFALAAIVIRLVPFYARETAETPARFGQMDGLRGFLALIVVACHAISYKDWAATKQWRSDAPIYTPAGSSAVMLFFMMTGFLFWMKAIEGKGRLDVRRLYLGRIRRLVPLYAVAVPLTFLYVGLRTDWALQVPTRTFVTEVGRWVVFGLPGFSTLNGFPGTRLTNPAVWTLAFEWDFYILLPVLAWFAFPRRFVWLAAGLVGLTLAFPQRAVIVNFVFGMAAAHVVHEGWASAVRRSPWFALVVAAGLLSLGLLPFTEYGVVQSLVVFPAFLCVVSDNPATRFFEMRPAKAIGAASYSLYLLHCPAFYGLLFALEGVVDVGSLPPTAYWLLVFALVPSVLAVAFVTFRWIEWPAMTARWPLPFVESRLAPLKAPP